MSYGGSSYGGGGGYGGYGGSGGYGGGNYGSSGGYGGGGDRYNTGYSSYGGGFQQRKHFEELHENDEQFRKIFIGGLHLDTTVDSLKEYFSKYGKIVDAIVMREPSTKKSRGFGFITFEQPSFVDKCQSERPHTVDGKEVDSRRATRKEDAQDPEAKAIVHKIFVGGLRKDTTEDDLHTKCIAHGGEVEKVDIIKDKTTGDCRGFAFVTFKDTDSADKIFIKRILDLNGKKVDVRKAVDKDGQRGDSGFSGGRGGGGGGGRGRGGQMNYSNYGGGQSSYGSGYAGQSSYGSGYANYGGGHYGSGYDSSYGNTYGSSYSSGPARGSGGYERSSAGYRQQQYGSYQ